jgi:hypothetical protein
LATHQYYPLCAVTSIKALGPESAHIGGLCAPDHFELVTPCAGGSSLRETALNGTGRDAVSDDLVSASTAPHTLSPPAP